MGVKLGKKVGRRVCDVRARTEDRDRTCLIQRAVIVRRDHTAHNDQNIRAPLLREFVLQLRHKREMAGSKRGHADNMHVVFHGLPRDLGWCRKKRADIHVEA